MDSCFKLAWKKHSQSMHLTLSSTSRESNSDFLDDDALPDSNAITTENEEQNDSSDWQIISQEKIYTPADKDIGYCLRVEVTAISLKDSVVLAGPVSVTSEAVLSSPSAPPKRPLTTIPGAAVGISSAVTRFRVVSYNILSELYATKQVS